MTSFIMRCIGVPGVIRHGPGPEQIVGSYLRSYDPEARDGYGESDWTADPTQARRFGTFRDAAETWRAIPASRPWRDDGKPNRPLTAYSVTFDRIEDDDFDAAMTRSGAWMAGGSKPHPYEPGPGGSPYCNQCGCGRAGFQHEGEEQAARDEHSG